MTKDSTSKLRDLLLEEIADDLMSLNGKELDDYLRDIDLDPSAIVDEFDAAVAAASAKLGRARFEEARRIVARGQSIGTGTIASLDSARKRKIAADIRSRAQQTGEMTIAARNQKIEDDADLDSFLEACVKLGMIDDEGNLKD